MPCSDWLNSAGYSANEIAQFDEGLNQLLEVNPVLVFLTSDQERALKLAVEARVEKWTRSLVSKRCGNDDPARWVDYFSMMRIAALQTLERWLFESSYSTRRPTIWIIV